MAGGAHDKDTLLVLYAPWCPFCQGGRAGRLLGPLPPWHRHSSTLHAGIPRCALLAALPASLSHPPPHTPHHTHNTTLTHTPAHPAGMEASYEELAQQLKGSHVRVAKYQADGADKEWCKENLGLATFPSIVMLPKGRSGFVKYPSERRDAETLGMWVRTLSGSA